MTAKLDVIQMQVLATREDLKLIQEKVERN